MQTVCTGFVENYQNVPFIGETMAKTDKPQKPALTGAQLLVIDALCSGATQGAAALAGNVDRHTVAKWQKSDAQFIAEWNARRYELQSENAERLRRLGGRAIDIIERSLDSIDESVALRAAGMLLKTLGLETVTPIKREDLVVELVEQSITVDRLDSLLMALKGMGDSSVG